MPCSFSLKQGGSSSCLAEFSGWMHVLQNQVLAGAFKNGVTDLRTAAE